jgi:hypothetical protein
VDPTTGATANTLNFVEFNLLLMKIIRSQRLSEFEQDIFLPVPFQAPCDFFFAGPNSIVLQFWPVETGPAGPAESPE